ncbi:MAG: hypothetical protein HRT72_06105 [Flavobacteriales bacterium]|nr:hypothetical protein [Flavobacteriales bacterium]
MTQLTERILFTIGLTLLLSQFSYSSEIDSVGSNDNFIHDNIKPTTVPLEMDNKKLGEIIKRQGLLLYGSQDGYWQLKFHDRILMIISDETHNRMRILTTVISKKDIKRADYAKMIEAQFDRALDIKYALFHETLWSVYIHPLKELTHDQFLEALKQVYLGAANYGGSYMSTDVFYK